MKSNKTNNSLVSVFLVLLLIWGTKFFSYSQLDPTLYGRLTYLLYGSLAIVFLLRFRSSFDLKKPLSFVAMALLFGMVPAIMAKPLTSGMGIMTEVETIKQLPLFLIFFLCYSFGLSERQLVRPITIVGFIILAIQVLQIIFPDSAVFGVFNEGDYARGATDVAEERNGIFRFRLESYMITLFCLFYYWHGLLSRRNLKYLVYFLLFAISLYFNLSRNLVFTALITLALSFLMIHSKKPSAENKRKSKLNARHIALFLTFVAVFVVLLKTVFTDFIADTQSDVSGSSIRFFAFAYYGLAILDSPLTLLFGNGHPTETDSWDQANMGLFPSDVGFVGECYYYGLIWIAIYFVTIYLLLFRHRKKLPLYIKLFLIDTALMSILIFPYRSGYEYMIWGIVLYIASNYIVIAERREKETSNTDGKKAQI